MSQAGSFRIGGGSTTVSTLTGNTGGPVPPTGGNIDIVGTGVVEVTGNPGTSTLTISVDQTVAETFTTDSGTATPVANNIDIIGGTGITTSAVGDTIIITSSATTGILQLEGDNGDTASGASVNVLGGDNITTAGDNASTITIAVSGASNHAIQVGNVSGSLTSLGLGTAGQVMTSNGVLSNPSFQSPAASSISITGDSGGALTGNAFTFTGGTTGLTFSGAVATETLTGTLVVSNGGTGRATLTNHGLLVGAGTSAITQLGAATNGQLPIGSTGADPVLATLSAGTNIAITNGAGTISIAANTTSQVVAYTAVNHAASPYTVLSADYYIGANVTAGVISILLPNAPTTGRIFVIKDVAGLSAASNITVTTVGGAVNIDGTTSFVANTAYESVSLIFNGAAYEIY